MLIMEAAFFMDFLMMFILDHKDPNNPTEKSIKDLSKIANFYFTNGFLIDVIALLPLHMIDMRNKR